MLCEGTVIFPNPEDPSRVFRLDPAIPTDAEIIETAKRMKKEGRAPQEIDQEVFRLIHEAYPNYRGDILIQ